MRHSPRLLAPAFILSMALVAGCGSKSGPAEPVAEMDAISNYLTENPDQDVDTDEDEMDEEGDLE